MEYLVDGHNLIPKLGWRLESLDDEEKLIQLLQEFGRLRRAQLEIYFDGALPGHASKRAAGTVTAHFIRQGSTADAAIEVRLAQLGRQARNRTIVSSDKRVLQAARAVHAHVLTSEDFAAEISRIQAASSSKIKTEATLAPEEVEEWLKEFEL